MNTLTAEIRQVRIQQVAITEDSLTVELSDGRTVSVPLAWYPRLFHGNQKERKNWRLIANGEGIHWRDLDEDISVENLLSGKPSGESQASFKRWIEERGSQTKVAKPTRQSSPNKSLHRTLQKARRR
jgi:Protein of unknown function (DUF2442)